jgi:hypothetical protein
MDMNQLKDILNDINIKDDMQKRLITKLKTKGDINYMRKPRIKWVTVAAAALIVCLSATAYAQGFFTVIKDFFIGNHAQYIEVEYPESFPLPSELSGKLYDENGLELTAFTKEKAFYNASGDEVRIVHDGQGNFSVLTIEEYMKKESKIQYIEFYSLEDGASNFISDIATLSYLPDGFSFSKVEFLSEAIKNGASKYMDIYYSNGVVDIKCTLRYMDEETAFESISDTPIEELKINGHDVVVHGNTLSIQIGNVLYTFYAGDALYVDTGELIKIAESME